MAKDPTSDPGTSTPTATPRPPSASPPQGTLADLLDGLASTLLLAEPGNVEDLDATTTPLKQLERYTSLADRARRAQDLVRTLREGAAADWRPNLDAVQRAVAAMQDTVEDGCLEEVVATDDPVPDEPQPDDPTAEDAPSDAFCEADEDGFLKFSMPEEETDAKEDDVDDGALVERDDAEVAVIQSFVNECEQWMEEADGLLFDMERAGPDLGTINHLFRLFHNLKGAAGLLHLKDIVKCAHETETVLDGMRNDDVRITDAVLNVLFDSTALINQLRSEVVEATESSRSIRRNEALPPLVDQLRLAGHNQLSDMPRPFDALPEDTVVDVLIRAGSLAPDAMGPTDEPQAIVTKTGLPPKLVGRALRSIRQSTVPDANPPREPTNDTSTKRAHPTPQERRPVVKPKLKETVTVDLERVDGLVELIGELVIVEAMVSHDPDILSLVSPQVRSSLGQLRKITGDLQHTGMRMRMVPLRGLFQKMTRMARDLARRSGKQIELAVEGEATEMDRSMVEQLGDPLVHMIRNAADHGLESVEERRASGKPDTGRITLRAYHQGGSVVIEMSDDGRGINRRAVHAKAIERGVVDASEQLSDNEIDNLIFAPGFSTAAQLTELSGRGVGMDVVKRNIESMRGRVSLTSNPGHGTVVQLHLPLTLAIINGTLVALGRETYIIPTLSIIRSVSVKDHPISSMAGRNELLLLRGEAIPVCRLERLFGADRTGEPTDAMEARPEGYAVIVESAGTRRAIIVDDVISQQQVVIKNLDTGSDDLDCFSGAAILSDGSVGLIVNVDALASARGLDELQPTGT